MLADDGFASLAGLARHLGVSRVWVSRVLKGMWPSLFMPVSLLLIMVSLGLRLSRYPFEPYGSQRHVHACGDKGQKGCTGP